MSHFHSRRSFIRNSSTLLALSSLNLGAWKDWASAPPRRVALIGSGWYGKSDLLRLAQVAPIEVVGLCDVDRNMLTAAEELIRNRVQPNKKIPMFGDYRKLIAETRPEITLICHLSRDGPVLS